MFADLIAFLIATFLLNPLQAAVQERLEAARAPQAVVRAVTDCAAGAGPALVQRATGDPAWAVGTAFSVWIGTAAPEAVLRDAAPGCAPAIEAARPFLRAG